MAAELTLAFLYTVGMEGKTVGRTDMGWIPRRVGIPYTSREEQCCAHGYLRGQLKCLLEETGVRVAIVALSLGI